MKFENPYQPSDAEMQKAEKTQSVKQRVMGELREKDVISAIKPEINEDTLRKIFVYEFSENAQKEGKHAIFSLDGHEIAIVENIEQGHDIKKIVRGQSPKFVGGRFGLMIDGVEIKDEALAEQMFRKYFDATRLIANDEMVEQGGKARYDYETGDWGLFSKATKNAEKVLEKRKESFGSAVAGDYTSGEKKRSYDILAQRVINRSPELQKEEKSENEQQQTFESTEAIRKEAAERVIKDAESARIKAEAQIENNKKEQAAIETVKGLL